MTATLSIVSILCFWLISAPAMAQGSPSPIPRIDGSYKGFVKIKEGHELYVDYQAPKAGLPTVVLLNGLTYSTRQWDSFTVPLQKHGVGVLRYDMTDMGQTLLKYAPATAPVAYEAQVEDLQALLTAMHLPAPYNLVGLSYGGGIGLAFASAHPDEIKNLILMAPYTQPVQGQDTWIKSQIWATRQMFPSNKATDDELYDYFLHQIIYSTYPQAEPVVLENPYILEGVYRLVEGIRKYNPQNQTDQLPKHAVHMMVGLRDQYIPQSVLNGYWDAVPQDAKNSRLLIEDCEHKIPEAVPEFAAAWVYQIVVKENPALFQGRDFHGYPDRGEARSDQDVIHLSREY